MLFFNLKSAPGAYSEEYGMRIFHTIFAQSAVSPCFPLKSRLMTRLVENHDMTPARNGKRIAPAHNGMKKAYMDAFHFIGG